MIYVTGYNDYSRLPIRLALNEKTAIQIDDRNWSTGIIMQRCWFGIRRVITESYSIWDDGSGGCVGTRYHVLATTMRSCRSVTKLASTRRIGS